MKDNSINIDKRFNILSLGGGGFLGLYTLTILEELEKRSGYPIARRFNLLAGTSIGGIIALALAAEIPVKTIKDAFEKEGKAIFPISSKSIWSSFFQVLKGLNREKYRSEKLKEMLNELIGADKLIGHLKTPVIIPTINITKGAPQTFKTPHHQTFQTDLLIKVTDVALATSAAPIYFPVFQIKNQEYIDGGLVANSPDLCALHEAQHFFSQSAENINILSIGTTSSNFSLANTLGEKFGLINWVKNKRLIKIVISSQQQLMNYMVFHRLSEKNYFRLDAMLSSEQEKEVGMDIATKKATVTLRGLAESTLQKYVNDPRLNDFLQHMPKPFDFYYLDRLPPK